MYSYELMGKKQKKKTLCVEAILNY